MKRGMILVMSWLLCCELFAAQYKTFEENGKVGMKDEDGRVVLPPSFEALGWSDGSFSVVGEVTGYRLRGMWGIINLKKQFVTKAEFETLVYSGGESIVARKKINSVFYKAGCLNLQGEIKIPFIYDGIQVQGLRAIVFNLSKSGYRYGLVDNMNKSILPINYKYIKPLGTLRYAAENDAGKIALFNENGSAVTDFVIDSVSSFYKGYAIVYQDHLQGLIDRDGATKLAVIYQSIKISESGNALTRLPNEWSFINEKNETTNHILTDDLKPLSEKLFSIKIGNRWGVVDNELKTVIPARYKSVVQISQGKYLARKDFKMGVIDEQNKIVLPFLFDSLIYQNGSFCAFTSGFGWQMVDATAKIISSHVYQLILPLPEGNFLVKNKGFFGLINSQGQEFVHCVFDSVASPTQGLIAVKFKGKYGIINPNEDWQVAPQDFPLQIINDKVYLQKQPDNQFVKTFSGEIKYFTPYQLKFNAEDFIETLPSGIEKTISYDGLIKNRLAPPENTETIFQESEGFRGIKKDDRYGFVDAGGKLRIANRYDSIGEFHEGLAAVKLIGKWGFVNASDHVVINPNYDGPSNFQNGTAVVSRNKKFGVIDKTGNAILPLRYDNVLRQNNSFLLIASKLKGLADVNGNVTVDPRFDSLMPTENNLLIVCRDGKCGAITNQGLNVIPMIYDRLVFNSSKKIFLAERKSEWKEILLN